MAQVFTRNQTADIWDPPSDTPSINLPAGNASDRRILAIGTYPGASVQPAAIAGFEISDTLVLGSNRLTVYVQTLGSAVSASTVALSYSDDVQGNYWCASVQGLVGTPQISTDSSYDPTRTIPALQSSGPNGRQYLIELSADYPRSVENLAGFSEDADLAQYTSASGGMWLGVRCRNVAQGPVSSFSYNLKDYNPSNPAADAGDRLMYVNFVADELPQTNTGSFDVIGELPSILLSVTPEETSVVVGEVAYFTEVIQGSSSGVTWAIIEGSGTIDSSGDVTTTDAGNLIVEATSVESPTIKARGSTIVYPTSPAVDAIADTLSPVTFAGTGDVGAVIEYTVDGEATLGPTVDSNGDWTVDVDLPAGSHIASFRQYEAMLYSQVTGPRQFNILPDGETPVKTSLTLGLNVSAAQVGQNIQLTVTVLDQEGNPMQGQEVGVEVTDGTTVSYGPFTTNLLGQYVFSRVAQNVGEFSAQAFSDDLTSTTETATVTLTLEPPVKTLIGLRTTPAFPAAGDTVEFEARVLDQYGEAIAGEAVTLKYTDKGTDTTTTLGPVSSDSAGYARFEAVIPAADYDVWAESSPRSSIVLLMSVPAESVGNGPTWASAKAAMQSSSPAPKPKAKAEATAPPTVAEVGQDIADELFAANLLAQLFAVPQPVIEQPYMPPARPEPLDAGTQKALEAIAQIAQKESEKSNQQMQAIDRMLQ